MTFCAIMIADFSGAKDVPLGMWLWMPMVAFGFFKLQGSEGDYNDKK